MPSSPLEAETCRHTREQTHLQQAFLLSKKLEDDRFQGDTREGGVEPPSPDLPRTDSPRFDDPLDRPFDEPRRPSTSPRPQFDLEPPEVDSDIKPNGSIKEKSDLDPASDLDAQP